MRFELTVPCETPVFKTGAIDHSATPPTVCYIIRNLIYNKCSTQSLFWYNLFIMTKIAEGVVHKVPKDLKDTLLQNTKVLEIWNGLTPLARNEWICYVTIVKKPETREAHIARIKNDLPKGKRRPCCWAGCPHRNPNSAKWFAKK